MHVGLYVKYDPEISSLKIQPKCMKLHKCLKPPSNVYNN